LWGGRFTGEADAGFAKFNESFSFDRRLFEADIRGSIAHSAGLVSAGVLTSEEADQIKMALERILLSGQRDSKYFDELSSEDVHSFVESRLVELIGDLGRKLHTGRSRNDQVATDLRLWLRDEIDGLATLLVEVQAALLDFAEANHELAIPGYTHLQRAQPILLAHWCLAYFEMLARDRERRSATNARETSAAGAAALAGTSFSIDREAWLKRSDSNRVAQ
jgi:argininosuccinate lyase